MIERELLQPEIITPATRNQATCPVHLVYRPSSGVKTLGIATFAVPDRIAFEWSGLIAGRKEAKEAMGTKKLGRAR